MRMERMHVPLDLLRTRELTPAAKLIWIVCRLDALRNQKRSHAPTSLARRIGIARSTVYEAFEQLEKTSWGAMHRERSSGKRRLQTREPNRTSGGRAVIPVELAETRGAVRPRAVICYGLLQTLPGFNGIRGRFKWADLSAATGLHLKTVKRAVSLLVEAGWLGIRQKNRLSPIDFSLQHADEAWTKGARSRLDSSEFKGEALMRELLSLIVDSREFTDGAPVGFLMNPETNHLLQLDRFYPLHRVAFEFNGKQHYQPTERYSKAEVDAQRKRDATKRTTCSTKTVTLVNVHAEDLSLEGMLRKVAETGALLPLRDLSGNQGTIRYLETVCRNYRAATERAERQTEKQGAKRTAGKRANQSAKGSATQAASQTAKQPTKRPAKRPAKQSAKPAACSA